MTVHKIVIVYYRRERMAIFAISKEIREHIAIDKISIKFFVTIFRLMYPDK